MLFIGTLASMVSASQGDWWRFHFSELGNESGYAGYQFNLSLITTGAVITALGNFVAHDLEVGLRAHVDTPQRRARLFAWLLAVIGLCLMVAGFVPDAGSVLEAGDDVLAVLDPAREDELKTALGLGG